MDAIPDALLCVLQVDTLSLYNASGEFVLMNLWTKSWFYLLLVISYWWICWPFIWFTMFDSVSQGHETFSWSSVAFANYKLVCCNFCNWNLPNDAVGEVVSIPLPYAVASIWPLPFGLLLQKSDRSRTIHSSSSLANERDLSRSNKDYGLSHHASFQQTSFEAVCKDNVAMMGSHLILKHPLEEPQVFMLGCGLWLYAMLSFNQICIYNVCICNIYIYKTSKLQLHLQCLDFSALECIYIWFWLLYSYETLSLYRYLYIHVCVYLLFCVGS